MAMCDLPREVCVRLLTFLPLDSRAACAVLSRTLRDAAADDSLWRSLSFDGVRNSRVTPAALRSLLQRAGSRLRRLNIAALENKVPRAYWEHSVVENVLYALRDSPAAAETLEELDMLLPEERELLQGAGVKGLRHLAFANFALPLFAAMPALRSFSGQLCTSTLGQGATALAALPRGMKHLALCGALIGDEDGHDPARFIDYAACFTALQSDTSVVSLRIEDIRFHEESATALAAALGPNTTLRHFGLCGNFGGQEAVVLRTICGADTVGCCLRSLGLRSSRLGDDGAYALSHAGCQLQSVDLSNNLVTGDGASVIAAALEGNSCLKKLNLWLNLIDDDNAAVFALMLANDGCALEELNLGAQLFGDGPPGSSLGDVAAAAFGQALGSNTLLRVLKLERGSITAAGAAALAAGLQRQRGHACGGLRRLTLAHNPLGARGVAALAEACCDTLTRLDVMATGCGDEAAAALGRALTPPPDGTVSPTRLAHLALGDNGITAVGMAALAAGLRRNTSVTVLDLRLNALGTNGIDAIAGALQQPGGNTCLELLIISDSGCAAWLPRSLRRLSPRGGTSAAGAHSQRNSLLGDASRERSLDRRRVRTARDGPNAPFAGGIAPAPPPCVLVRAAVKNGRVTLIKTS